MGGIERPRGIVPAVPMKYERRTSKQNSKVNNHDASRVTSKATASSVQDYGIEKHGKLPPSFYPSVASDHGPPLSREPLEAKGEETPAVTPPPQVEYPQWTTPESAYPANPTPPNDGSPTPFHYSVDAQTFRPQPTPPSDVTPSPTQSLYQRYSYPYNISFYPPQTSEFADSPPSATSVYHGYTYAPPLMNATMPAQLYNPIDYTCPTELPMNDFPIEGQNGSYSEVDSPSSPQESPEIDSTSHSGAQLETPPLESSDSDRHNSLGKQSFPQSSHVATTGLLHNGQKGNGDMQSFSDPFIDDQQPEAAEGYDVWRRTALNDLRTVSEELQHEQSTMPSFFLQHFNSPRYADCRIRISVKERPNCNLDLLLHSVLLTYSPTLALELELSEPASDGLRLIVLDVSDKFITPDAIESALYTCYGRPLCDFIGTTLNVAFSYAQDSTTWMENALAFVAAGKLLGLPAVIARGLQIAMRILNWDNVEKALSFALDGLAKEDPVFTDSISTLLHGLKNPKSIMIEDHAVDQLPVEGKISPNPEPMIRKVVVDPHSMNAVPLVASCLQTILHQFSQGWKLDTSAPPLSSVDRFPQTLGRRPSIPKSRLSQIQFGSLSPEEVKETQNFSEQDAMLSSIMLSIPFSLLKPLVSELHSIPPESLKTLVDERERRRHYILQECPAYSSGTQSLENSDPVGWEEYVDMVTDDKGTRPELSRRWTGLDTATNV